MPRGINAVQEKSELLDAQKGSLMPCYIGAAPYWQVDRADWDTIAGSAFIINSLPDARSKIGFLKPPSGRWPKHSSLGEAVYAHFGQSLNAVGPIIVLVNAASIDVKLDDVTSEPEIITANVAMSNGVGVIDVNGLAILSTVAIAGKIKGVDYTVIYDDSGDSIIVTDLNKSLGANVSVTYSIVDGLDTLSITTPTFSAIDYFEQTIGEVPTVFSAPCWEDAALDGVVDGVTVAEKLIEISEGQINSHWYTQAYVQLTSLTRNDVATEKTTKGYNSPKMKVCWPFVRKNGLIYSISTKFIVSKMIVDIANENVPFESASNEILDIDGLCDMNGTIILQKESDANALNDIGVATCNFAGGSWRTWGVCMSNYLESNKDNILPEYLNDVAVQMRDYVCNDFQVENFDYIDKPIPTRKAKEIVDDYQLILNALVNSGALLFGEITFQSGENPISALANGEFLFNIAETSTPPGKSITGKVKYTAAGLDSYFSEEA
jgi:hypothetical protein